jgi:hypothetical protein
MPADARPNREYSIPREASAVNIKLDISVKRQYNER